MSAFGVTFQLTNIILSDKYDYINLTDFNANTLYEFNNFTEHVLDKHFKSDHYSLLLFKNKFLNNNLLGNSMFSQMCKKPQCKHNKHKEWFN